MEVNLKSQNCIPQTKNTDHRPRLFHYKLTWDRLFNQKVQFGQTWFNFGQNTLLPAHFSLGSRDSNPLKHSTGWLLFTRAEVRFPYHKHEVLKTAVDFRLVLLHWFVFSAYLWAHSTKRQFTLLVVADALLRMVDEGRDRTLYSVHPTLARSQRMSLLWFSGHSFCSFQSIKPEGTVLDFKDKGTATFQQCWIKGLSSS